MGGVRYVPDEEARSLAWANARQNGARQQFNPIRDVEVVREMHRRHDDPLGIDSEPSLTDEQIETAERQVDWSASIVTWSFIGPFSNDAIKTAVAITESIRRLAVVLDVSVEDAGVQAERLSRTSGLKLEDASDMLIKLNAAFASSAVDFDAITTALRQHETPDEVNRRKSTEKAAVCPRHGPTRGGTCMRCRR